MILLTEVAKKLQDILNGENNPIDFQFVVATQGYHLDSISDHKTGKNTIPVFIGLSGGEYNAIPKMKQASFNILVSLWFPVRFKEHFYLLNEFLADTFVGKEIDYGTISGTALSNISVAQYGELTGVDLRQYKEWVEETYVVDNKKVIDEIDVMEQYMSMQFTLYLLTLGTTEGEKSIFGNAISYKLKGTFSYKLSQIKVHNSQTLLDLVYKRYPTGDLEGLYAWRLLLGSPIYTKTDKPKVDDKVYDSSGNEIANSTITEITEIEEEGTKEVEENCIWTSSGTGKSITPLSQQLIDTDDFVKNTPNITNYNKSIIVYARVNEFWKLFIDNYNRQLPMNDFTLTKTYQFGEETLSYEFSQITLTENENIALGEPLSYTLAFGDK